MIGLIDWWFFVEIPFRIIAPEFARKGAVQEQKEDEGDQLLQIHGGYIVLMKQAARSYKVELENTLDIVDFKDCCSWAKISATSKGCMTDEVQWVCAEQATNWS